jgi:hypothetical protein
MVTIRLRELSNRVTGADDNHLGACTHVDGLCSSTAWICYSRYAAFLNRSPGMSRKSRNVSSKSRGYCVQAYGRSGLDWLTYVMSRPVEQKLSNDQDGGFCHVSSEITTGYISSFWYAACSIIPYSMHCALGSKTALLSTFVAFRSLSYYYAGFTTSRYVHKLWFRPERY